jgi:hypothetical protein
MEITIAGRSHACRFDKRHRVPKGASRLTLFEGRAKLNYCLLCARSFTAQSSARLAAIQTQIHVLLAAPDAHRSSGAGSPDADLPAGVAHPAVDSA